MGRVGLRAGGGNANGDTPMAVVYSDWQRTPRKCSGFDVAWMSVPSTQMSSRYRLVYSGLTATETG